MRRHIGDHSEHGRIGRKKSALVLAVLGLLLLAPSLRADTGSDAVERAFERARAAGSYHFSSDVEAVTAPIASARTAGTSSQTDHLSLEGTADLDDSQTEFTMWTGARSADSSVAFRMVDGITEQRRGDGPWEPSSSGTPGFTPRGDQLSFLLGAADIVDLGPVPGIDATRYGFDLDGTEFAAAMTREMTTSMRDDGMLPPGARVAIPEQYRDMTGSGELWVDRSSGLPLRNELTVQFPPQADSVVTAHITTDFSRFGYADSAATRFTERLVLQPLAAAARLAPFALLAAAVFVLWRRHPETAQTALIVVLAVGVLVAGPLASSSSAMSSGLTRTPSSAAASTSELDQIAALTRQAKLAAGSAVDPHLDRRASASPSLVQVAGVDSDGDGLTDEVENEIETNPLLPDSDGDGLDDDEEVQIGTDPLSADTDGDGYADLVELDGFTLPGAGAGAPVWYPDPNVADSNEDGIPDSIEWDVTDRGAANDTDGDGVPDLFDTDNDGDGVPDHRDLSPFTQGSQTFDDENPLALTLDGLTPGGLPTFVEVQLRPANADHLRYALRPLDWPKDLSGQIRDVNDSVDDLSLIPMLEIDFPTNAPVVPDAASLEPYSIRLDDTDDPSTAYVPLTMITDERTGENVAFGGRMRYQSPSAGQNWGGAHEVRLVWTVRVDNDIVCTPGDPDPLPEAPAGSVCGADGYRYDRPQSVHSYVGDWTITGLQVTEEHGAQTALIHEDPTVDDDALENGPTWALADVLSERLLTAVPEGGGSQVYELEIDDLEARFDHESTSTADARYGLPDVFSVEHRSHQTFDDAMHAVTEDVYDQVLPRYGSAGAWSASTSPMPLVMTAYASDTRTLTLDDQLAAGARVGWNGPALRLDVVPEIDRTRTAGITWGSYCGGTASSPVWSRCEVGQVADRLEDRYTDVHVDPDDPTRPYDESSEGVLDPDIVRGQDLVMMGYYLAVANGISTVLSRTNAAGSTTNITPFAADGDTELKERVLAGARVAKMAAQQVHNKYLEGALPYVKKVGTIQARNIYKLLGSQGAISSLKKLAPTSVLGGIVLVGVVGIGVALGFAMAGNPEAQVALKVTASVAGTIASLAVFVPAANLARGYFAGQTLALLKSSSTVLQITKTATFIGTVIVLGVVWGFFISEMVSNGIVAGSPAFNAALSTVLATSIFIVLLAVLSLTVAGALLVGIVAAIDGILTLICEYGSADDRAALTVDGACFTIGGSIIKGLADFLYTYDPLVDLGRDDLVSVEVPDDEPLFKLADASRGYAVGNQLDVALDVTTDIRHARPGPTVQPYYLSADSLTSSTFEYSVTSPGTETLTAEMGQMRSEWETPVPTGWFLFSELLGTKSTERVNASAAITLDQHGLAVPFRYNLNMAYATPALECWIPYLLPFICDVEPLNGDTSIAFDPVYFDVFPATIDEFLATTETTETTEGYRFGWDRGFETIADFDGDGLRSAASGGLDPDDENWDSDGDGLSDSFELAQREQGSAYSPTSTDTDGDGLDDGDEFRHRTDPAVVDSDRDGLSDAEEIVGWEITLDRTGRTVRVTSDPLAPDTDFDGVNDEAERFLANDGQYDEAGHAFHPRTANIPPLEVSITSDAPGGYVRAGDQVEIETTVETTVPLAPSVLDIETPAGDPLPVVLDFDPEGDARQSIVRTDAVTVPAGWSGDFDLGAQVRGRLVEPAQSPATDLTSRSPMASSHRRGWVEVVPMTDDPNSFAMVDEADDAGSNPFGSVWPRVPGTGIDPKLQLDDDTDTTVNPPRKDWEQHKTGGVTTACTDDADCMTVWPYAQNCMAVTVNSIRVNDVSDQNGDLEVGVYLNRTTGSFDISRFEQLWHSVADGPGSLDQDQTAAVGTTTDLCGFGYLAVVETDGEDRSDLVGCDGAAPETTNCKPLLHRRPTGQIGLRELSLISGEGPGTYDAIFEFEGCPDSNCDEVVVNYTLKAGFAAVNGQVDRLAAAVTDGVSSITRSQFGIRGVGPTAHDHAPAIASDGDRFLLVWTATTDMPDGRVAVEFMWREYDRTGAPVGDARLLETAFFQQPTDPIPTLDIAWTHGRAPVIVTNRALPAGEDWTFVKPLPSTASAADAVDLAIDSQTGIATAVHETVDGIYATWFQAEAGGVSDALGTRRVIMLGAGNANELESPVVARVPGAGGWIIGARYVGPTNADVLVGHFSESYFLNTASPRGNPSAPAGPGELMKLDTAFADRHSLACESGTTPPVADLRFEELPGATEFADSSRLGNHGTAPAGLAPAAGLAGGPAPDSDFAALLRSLQQIDLPNATEASTTLSVWVREDPATSPLTPFLWVRDPQADGYSLSVYADRVSWQGGGDSRTESSNGGDRPHLLDGDWHHVAVTRSATGIGAIYVDGQPWAQGYPIGDPAGGPLQIVGDGVLVDDFKMFDRALDPQEVEGLMTRTPIDRCVVIAAESFATGNDGRYPWAELTLMPHDPVALLLASAQLGLQVDDSLPTPTIVSPPGVVRGGTPSAPGTYVLSGSVSDVGSGVAGVEVSVDNGPWVAAEGLDTWSYAMNVVDGTHQVRVRAVDAVGNTGLAVGTVVADGLAPAVTLDAVPATPVAPGTDDATGAPTVRLEGSASDAASGIEPAGVEVQLVPSPSDPVTTEQDWQPAELVGDRWTVEYQFSNTASDITGPWDVRVRATDAVGNVSDHDDVSDIVLLDATAPEVILSERDTARTVIAGDDVLGLAGGAIDPGEAGIASLEIAFTPLATLLALPDGATVDDLPEAPTWLPVELADSGPGVAATSWSFALDGEFEDSYQVDLRATDALGNQAVRPNIWRGVIDTKAPRLTLAAEPTGETHTGGTRFEVSYDCGAEDLFLDTETFDCDEGSNAPAVQSHVENALLHAQFPDLPQLDRMETAFTRWERGPVTDVRFSACDLFGNCTSTEEVVDDGGVPAPDLQVAVVDPTDGQHVAVDGPVDVAVVAEAEASIRSLVMTVDGEEVARRTFADGDVTVFDTRIPVDVIGGTHTVLAVVEDWAGATKTSQPMTFFADMQAPAVTLESTDLTAADNWGPGSDMIRFHGNVSDDGTIALVEIQVNDGEWTDVIVDGDGWRGAVPVPDADGSDLVVRVRAEDLATRSTVVSEDASVDLSPESPDFLRPDTAITSGPTDETTEDSATFDIDIIPGSNEAVSLVCRLDGGAALPCPDSWTLDALSGGDHRVEVAAVDSSGYEDLSPATWEWSVTPTGPQVEIVDGPTDPTSDRAASVSFTSESQATFECRLDGAEFESCASPATYEELADGIHRFEVRATVAGTTGSATAHVWSVANATPIARDQALTYGPDPDGTPVVLEAIDDDPLTFRIVDGPDHGLLEGAGPDRTYRPVTGFEGVDQFTFQAFDGDEWSNVATVTLDARTPTVSWPEPDSIVYGTSLSDEQLDATSPTPGSFTYVPTAGTLLPAGTHTLTATFVPDDEQYDTVTVEVALDVIRRPLQISASSDSHPYGTPPPAIVPSYEGFAPGEDVDDLDTPPSCESTSTETSGTGSYVSRCAGASDANYDISLVTGLVRVTRAATALFLDDVSILDSLRTESVEFSASLRSEATGGWLEGQPVRFQFSDDTPTCDAVTNADGRATCEVDLTQEAHDLLFAPGEIQAFFDGTGDLEASSDSAHALHLGPLPTDRADGRQPSSSGSDSLTGLGSAGRHLASTGAGTHGTVDVGLRLLAAGLLLCMIAAVLRRHVGRADHQRRVATRR